MQRAGEAGHEGAVADLHRHVEGAHDDVASALPGIEPERHGLIVLHRWAHSRHPLQTFAATLGLPGVLAGDVPGDVIRLGGDASLLLLECALLRQPPLGALHHEVLVRAGVRRGGVPLEVEDVVHCFTEESAVVTHQEDGAIDVTQVFLEPARGIEVEVIRGFVEQQDLRGADELSRQAKPSAFTATQRRHRCRPRLLRIETESMEDGIDTGRNRVAALALEPLEVTAITIERRFRRVRAQRRRLLDQRKLEFQQLRELAGRRFPDGGGRPEVAVLLEQRYAQARLPGDRSAGRRELAGQQSKERGFSRPVTPDDAPALARRDRERDVGEQFERAEVDPDSGEGKLGHE